MAPYLCAKYSRYAASAVILTFIAGCSLQPVYQRPALPVADVFPTGQAYQTPAAKPGSTSLPAADIGWRNFLPDPRLQQLVELALQNNRDLRVAVLNVEKVRAQYQIQRASQFRKSAAMLAPRIRARRRASHPATTPQSPMIIP